jgi:hypothetical protein
MRSGAQSAIAVPAVPSKSATVAKTAPGTALVDGTDRERFTDGAPRSLTFSQADRAISAFAAKLRRLGLHP